MGADEPGADRPEQLFDPAVHRLDLLHRQPAARDSALVGDHGGPDARRAQPLQRRAGPGHEHHPGGIAVVWDVDHQSAVAVEEDRRRPRPRPPPAPQSAQPVIAGGEGDDGAGDDHGCDLGSRPGTGGYPAQSELCRSAQPTRACQQAHPSPPEPETGEGQGRRRRDRQVKRTATSGGAGAPLPAGPVQGKHQGVVRVAPLQSNADPAVCGADRMADPALALDDAMAGGDHAQGQVGVLPEGVRETLVEAAERGQDRAPVSHVGRRPARPLQSAHVSLPVGRPAA